MKRFVLALTMAAAVAFGTGPANAQIQWAGNGVINLDAADLTVGDFAPWINTGTAGGTFDVAPTSPWVVFPADPLQGNITVAAVNRGLNNVEKKVVKIDNLNSLQQDGTTQLGGRRPANSLVWSNQTDALFGGAASSFSVEAWIYDEQFTGLECFMGLANRDNGLGWISFWAGVIAEGVTESRVLAGKGSSDTYANLTRDPRPDPALGTFSYFAFVHDNTLSTIDVYINGGLVQTIAMSPGLTIATGQPVYIGGYGRLLETQATLAAASPFRSPRSASMTAPSRQPRC